MDLNVNKCKVKCLSRSKLFARPRYAFGSDPLEIVDCYKYLGVTISNDLSWKKHTDLTVSKATIMSGFVKRLVISRDPLIQTKLFCALVRPIIEYACPVWFPGLNTLQHSMESVQRRFTRFCLGLPRGQIPGFHINNLDYTARRIQLG